MDLRPDTGDIVLRVVLSLVFAAVLGVEREWSRKPAGLRTHLLVCLGSTAFTLVALEFYGSLVASGNVDVTRADPLRLVEGIIGGIGFLGAGSIIQSQGSVEGLTTASSIWLVGAIGIAIGGGHFVIAGTTTAAGLLVLRGLGYVEKRFFDDRA
ncbi:MAG: MgtC/SapB family protein [Deltaproteobacteria bacterium]|nr:MgtC/SapB family protein [Deltaproteobacteria bacterium]